MGWDGMSRSASRQPITRGETGWAGEGGGGEEHAAVSQQVWKAAVCFLYSFHGC